MNKCSGCEVLELTSGSFSATKTKVTQQADSFNVNFVLQ